LESALTTGRSATRTDHLRPSKDVSVYAHRRLGARVVDFTLPQLHGGTGISVNGVILTSSTHLHVHASRAISLLSGIVTVFQLFATLVAFILSIQNVKSGTSHAFSTKLIFVLHHVESSTAVLFLSIHVLPSLHVPVVILKSLGFEHALLLGVFLLSNHLIMLSEILLVTVGRLHVMT